MERTTREIMDNCQALVNNIREYPTYLYPHKDTLLKIESMIYGILDDIMEEVEREVRGDD